MPLGDEAKSQVYRLTVPVNLKTRLPYREDNPRQRLANVKPGKGGRRRHAYDDYVTVTIDATLGDPE